MAKRAKNFLFSNLIVKTIVSLEHYKRVKKAEKAFF